MDSYSLLYQWCCLEIIYIHICMESIDPSMGVCTDIRMICPLVYRWVCPLIDQQIYHLIWPHIYEHINPYIFIDHSLIYQWVHPMTTRWMYALTCAYIHDLLHWYIHGYVHWYVCIFRNMSIDVSIGIPMDGYALICIINPFDTL